MNGIGGHDKAVAGRKALRSTVNRNVKDSLLDERTLDMGMRVRLPNGTSLEANAYHHDFLLEGQDSASDAAAHVFPFFALAPNKDVFSLRHFFMPLSFFNPVGRGHFSGPPTRNADLRQQCSKINDRDSPPGDPLMESGQGHEARRP